MTRIGIYGGTFSPPHNGHIAAAKAFMEQMWLDFLFVIPTSIPPHKQLDGEVSAEDRLEMCRLAFRDVEGVYVSDTEIRRGGVSYTVDTLRELSGDDRRLFLLLGTDMVLTLDEWREPEEIFRLSYPAYVRRENDPIVSAKIVQKLTVYQQKYGKIVRKILTEPMEVSSSMIRERLHGGAPITGMVPPAVEDYIRNKHLYV